MPHQCVRCGTLYDDGSTNILKGCKCGARLFFFVKKEALEKVKNYQVKLTQKEKKQIEKDVCDLVGVTQLDTPVILDLEAIRVTKPGKFELDLVQLFNKEKPLIYRLEDGKYLIDIPQTFMRRKELREGS